MRDYPPSSILPGTVYRIVQTLGHGGMGTVYEVEDTTLGKRFVAKTLHSELRDHKELALRIENEARTLAKLSHPNIVEVVTAGVTADELRLPYFVMQKLDGLTVRELLNEKTRLPLATAYSIAIDLLDALDHAHAIGVIHRDVKPENLFVHRDASGACGTKLLDFGVVRVLASNLALSGGRFVGTMRYAPPEQLMGGAITPRTDLYAAGLVLFEMVAGHGPFDAAGDRTDIARAHLETPAPSLASVVPGIPRELEALVASALSKDPAGRPVDAFTFASRLRELAGYETREAHRAPAVPPATPVEAATPPAAAPRFGMKRVIAIVIGAAIGVAIAVALLAR